MVYDFATTFVTLLLIINQEGKFKMLIFKLLFSRRFRTLRKLLIEVRMYWPPPLADEFLSRLRFFPYLFYTHGFLGVNQISSFPNAYKNISADVFKKTYITLPLYFALRSGLQNSSFTSVEQLVSTLSKKFPTLDTDVLHHLSLEWKEASREELDRLLYQQFKAHGVFHNVFAAAEADVEKWFRKFLNQTFDYTVHNFPLSNKNVA